MNNMATPGKVPFGAPFQERMPFDMSSVGRFPLNVPPRENIPLGFIPPERFAMNGLNFDKFPLHLNAPLNMATSDRLPPEMNFQDRMPQNLTTADKHSLNLASQMRMPLNQPSSKEMNFQSNINPDKNKMISAPVSSNNKVNYSKSCYDAGIVKTEQISSQHCSSNVSQSNIQMSSSSGIPLLANNQLYTRNLGCMEEVAVECLHNLYRDQSKNNLDKAKNCMDNKMGAGSGNLKQPGPPMASETSVSMNNSMPPLPGEIKCENISKPMPDANNSSGFIQCGMNIPKMAYNPNFGSDLMGKKSNGLFPNNCMDNGVSQNAGGKTGGKKSKGKSKSGASGNQNKPPYTGPMHECPICSKSFKRKDHLTRHKTKVHYNHPLANVSTPPRNEYDPSLKVSELEYKNYVNSLKESIVKLLISKDQPYQCPDCQKIFTRKDHVLRHKLTHSKLKPYECDICNKIFKRKDHMLRHRNIHTKERPYDCQFCDKIFTRKDHLDRHIQKNHIEQPKQHLAA